MINTINNTKINCSPLYVEMEPYWQQMRDTAEYGEKAVKDAGTDYLPKTSGQKADGDLGNKNYEAYKTRANYINFSKRTIKKADGLLNSKPYIIEVPKEMEIIKKNATIDKESIETLIRITQKNQMIYSRFGYLIDFPMDVKPGYVPYIVKYSWDSIVNFNDDLDEYLDEKILNFVLLDESGLVFNKDTKDYDLEYKYRLLGLAKYRDGVKLNKYIYYTVILSAGEWNGWDIEDPDLDNENLVIPQLAGIKSKRTIDYIPFIFINTTNNISTPEIPLLYDQSNLSLAYYRGDADHRQVLFLQAFALLILSGFTKEDLKGGVRADGFLSSSSTNAKASYAQVSGAGIEQIRLSQLDIKNEAIKEGVTISDKEGVESGTALSTRITMQTADLSDLAKTCGNAIYRALYIIADWMGLNTDEIKVIPNTDFKIETEDFRIVAELWSVVKEGGMSKKDFYNMLKENNYTKEQTFEEWEQNLGEIITLEEKEDVEEDKDIDIEEEDVDNNNKI